tara:strand:- start:731 stop:1075 length:345 start_codon:yes stop_codon:yes gene_type:complete
MTRKWIPEIMYEDSEEGSSHIPFIMVPPDQVMPEILYIFESRDTGKQEPGLEGDPVPVYEWDLHQYGDLNVLKQNLNKKTYDKVRIALGLEPMDVASEKGQKITDKIKSNLNLK